MSGVSSVPASGSYYVNYSPYAPTIPDDAVGTGGMPGQACSPEEELASADSNVSINFDQPALEDRYTPPSVGQAALGGAFGFTSVACDCGGINLTGDEGDAEVADAEGDGEPDEVPSEDVPSEVEGVEGEDFSYEDYVDEYYDESSDEYADETPSEDVPSEVEGVEGEDYYEDWAEEVEAPSACDHSPEAFDLTSPADGTIGVPYYSDSAIDIAFPYPHDLDEAIGDEVTCYAEIDDDPSFATPISRPVPEPGVLAFTPASPAEYFTCATDYWARVRCFDSCATETHEVVSDSYRMFTTGPTLEWSTTAGVSDGWGSSIALGNEGDVYLTGSDVYRYLIDGSPVSTTSTDGAPIGITVDPAAGDVLTTGIYWSFPLPDYADVWVGRFTGGANVWQRNYNGSMDNFDRGNDLAVDSAGNIHVAGTAYASSSFTSPIMWFGVLTPDGTLSRQEYPETGEARGIAVDDAGYSYITGSRASMGAGTPTNIWTLRMGPTGSAPLWERSYDGSVGDDQGQDIAVDDLGNSYISGFVSTSSEARNIWMGSYDSDGNPSWSRTYDGPAGGDDEGLGIAIDGLNGLYSTGYISVPGEGTNLWVGRFDASGSLLCETNLNGSANRDDRGEGIAVDGAGNVYIVGTEGTGGSRGNIWVLRYSGF